MVTSRDVARLANVSQATVSRVLHNSPSVSEDIRLRVLSAFKETGYVANVHARAMRTRRTGIVGVVSGHIVSPWYFYPDLIDAIGTSLASAGQRMILWNTGDSSEPVAVDAIQSGAVDGVIFTTATSESEALKAAMVKGAPIVLTNRSIEGAACDQVTTDNVSGGRLVARHFLEGGHTKLAVVGGQGVISTMRQRRTGFLTGAADGGVTVPVRWDPPADYTYAAGMELGMQLLSGRDRPTAIFCINDLLAFGVLDAARRLKIAVPDDLWVAGYDDVEIASWPAFDLTTVRQPVSSLAQVAVEMLLRRIGNEKAGPFEHRQFSSELILRATTGAQPA
jgi:LacI family transcriptional regulator